VAKTHRKPKSTMQRLNLESSQGVVPEWRRPIGCLILRVTFRKIGTTYMALLQEKTHKHIASYGSSPPCTSGISRGLLPTN